MNMAILLRTADARLRYLYDNNISFPTLKTEVDSIPLSIFPKSYTDFLNIILPLSSAWDLLSEDDKLSISELIVGKRNKREFYILMKWMNKRVDIDNYLLDIEIDTNQ